MLIVTRKVQESVIVREETGPERVLKVTVLAIQGDRVKLGFLMDDDVISEHWEVLRGSCDGITADLVTTEIENTAYAVS